LVYVGADHSTGGKAKVISAKYKMIAKEVIKITVILPALSAHNSGW
jgi:hypothetical protein